MSRVLAGADYPFMGPSRENDAIVAAALGDDSFLLETILANTSDHVYVKDAESRFLRISGALARWFGLSDPALAVGKTDADFFSAEHAQKARADEVELLRSGVAMIAVEERETWPDGSDTWMSTTKMPICDPDGRVIGLFGMSREITDRKRAEQAFTKQASMLVAQARELERLTLHDELTGLHNRRGLITLGGARLDIARRLGLPFTLVYVDLDGLKHANDVFGHASGDLALVGVADVLRATLDEQDLIARVSGDEFCAIVTDRIPRSLPARIRAAAARVDAEGRFPFPFAVSVGVARAQRARQECIDTLISRADALMYRDKRSPRAA